MPVPTTFADLSTTPGSNSPPGSEAAFPNLDDYIRIAFAMLASVKANTATNGWVSPYLPNASALVFNESGADIDARFEGDTDANLVFLDASTDRIGIGTATPSYKLHAVAASTSDGFAVAEGGANKVLVLGDGTVKWNANAATNYGLLTWDTGLARIQTGNAVLTFYVNGADRVKIDASGNFLPVLQASPPTLATNGQLVFNLTSDTNLRISVRGSDGTTRVADITLA